MTDLLGTTLREGTGQSARWRGFTKTGAGKTGTTNESTNAWFCGFTPSFCGGVWVGFDEPAAHGPQRHRRAPGAADLGEVHGPDHRREGRRALRAPAGHHRETGLPRLGPARDHGLRLHRASRSSCRAASRRRCATCTAADSTTCSGVDKGFDTLDKADDDVLRAARRSSRSRIAGDAATSARAGSPRRRPGRRSAFSRRSPAGARSRASGCPRHPVAGARQPVDADGVVDACPPPATGRRRGRPGPARSPGQSRISSQPSPGAATSAATGATSRPRSSASQFQAPALRGHPGLEARARRRRRPRRPRTAGQRRRRGRRPGRR